MRPLERYGIAVAIFAAAVLLSRLIEPYAAPHTTAPYYLAVLLSALIGGAIPGLVVTLASSFAIAWFDLGTTGTIHLGIDDIVRLAVFTTTALVISYISARRAAAEHELRDALDSLAALDRSKDEFIAAVSHELKTPLTGILGWLRILDEEGLDLDIRRQALDSIRESARTQAMLVDDLLDVSRIVVGKLTISRTPVELAEVIRGAVDAVRPSAEAHALSLKIHLPPAPIVVHGDRDRLKQVVWNLLNNSIKFTPAGGRIDVSLRQEANEAVIEVADTGEGIGPDLLPHVFRRFRQGEGGEARGGLGLGLAIVEHVVQLHGGRVSAASAGKGRGATFTARLPITPPE